MATYDHTEIEKTWRQYWQDQDLFKTDEHSDKPKHFSLVMFPYPSGDLHIGHWYNFAVTDMHAKYMRMMGYNVLQPIGFDAFGLPAENAAIKRGLHPQAWTQDNVASMIKQLKTTGISYDWDRVVNSSAPDYYKWTQWMFLKFYEKGLAYRKKAKVNWCEHDQTVLANEQVIDGLCWRCDNPVVQKELEQWFFKITEYAQELLDCLEDLDWPATTKLMQKNWIGQSQGAVVNFDIELADKNDNQQTKNISVFTTRPDTLFGVSYIVLAPEHDLVTNLTISDKKVEVEKYINQVNLRTERQRLATNEAKTGVFTGSYAIHPLTGQPVPIWIADYVLGSYGTGAVMGVPAHDKRDWDFATAYNLPITKVIDTPEDQQFGGQGKLINSQQFDGLSSEEAKTAIAQELAKTNHGQPETIYRMRDWLISRQRYWGPPIPMVDCADCGLVPVPEDQLPVILPEDVDFMPKGKPPLATNAEFINTTCPKCNQPAKRVAETLDTFVDSSWYFLRFADPHNDQEPFSQQQVKKWLPVDTYVGGAEHIVLHLLYSRFFVKALRDMGYLDFDEPFLMLRHQGMILGPDHQKMSKSKGNVINPDELVELFGADAVRMQLAFLGPYDQGGPWQLTGIHGMSRFLNKVYQEQERRKGQWAEVSSDKAGQALANSAKKVAEDIKQFKFNTAIAQLMTTINTVNKEKDVKKEDWQSLIITLAPFAPHLAEQLWHDLGNQDSVLTQDWPKLEIISDNAQSQASLAVQVNGKFRATVQVEAGTSEAEAVEEAQQNQAVLRHLEGKQVVKTVYVPGKVLNFIVN